MIGKRAIGNSVLSVHQVIMTTSCITFLITFIVIFPALFNESYSVEITFSPSCSGGFSCSLLSTFRPVPPPSTNLTLVFSPGVHRMSSSTLSLMRHKFVELKPKSTGSTTMIFCASAPLRHGSPRYNLAISYAAEVKISGLTFSGCKVQFLSVNKTLVQNTTFFNGNNGAIQFSNSFNIAIDQSTFNNNKYDLYRGAGAVIKFSNSFHVAIQNSIFTNHSCGIVVHFSSTAGIKITRTNFTNNSVTSQVLGMASCSNVTIDKSTFANNTAKSHNSKIVGISSATGMTITRSNFSNNRVLSHAAFIILSSSFGYVGCSNFHNNSIGSYSTMVRIQQTSSVSLHNIIFKLNRAKNYGSIMTTDPASSLLVSHTVFDSSIIDSYGKSAILNGDTAIISSVFNKSKTSRGTGSLKLGPSATIIASKFQGINLDYGYSSSLYSSNDISIHCSIFVNASIPTRYLSDNEGLCAKHGVYKSTKCSNTDCSCKSVQ